MYVKLQSLKSHQSSFQLIENKSVKLGLHYRIPRLIETQPSLQISGKEWACQQMVMGHVAIYIF